MGLEAKAPLMDLKLKLQGEVEIVKPAEPTDNTPVYLTNIDKVVVIPVETVYFYIPSERSTDTLVDTLKDALAKVLVPYHFAAGRLRLNEKVGRLEIDCNAAGAQFASYTSELSLADLGDVTLPNPLFRNLVPTKFSAIKISDVPLLAVQITRFIDGGFSLGYMMSHTIFDGFGAIDFFANFTSLAKGNGVLFTPWTDRTVLKARDPPSVEFPHPELLDISLLAAAGKGAGPFSGEGAADAEFVALEALSKFETKVVPFTLEIINALKQKALEDGTLKKVSTFDVVTAHLWQCRTKTIDVDPTELSRIMFAVDIRDKVKPRLPEHYAGNAVIPAFASLPVQDVREKSLAYVVGVIQEVLSRITNEFVRSAIDWGEIHHGVPALFGGVFISAWWKMPFYDIDFGWGKPLYAGPINTPLVEFIQLLSNGKQDGGLNVIMYLEPHQVSKFEEYFKL